MIKKRIKEIRDYVFAENENFTLEHRIFLSTIIYGILVCMIGSIVAILYMSSNISVIISLLICGICCMTYYFVRFKRIITPFIMPLIVISFIGISVVWILGGGIEGSIILTFILALILAIIIAPDKFKKYVITLFLLLVIIIYAIQFFRPDLIIHFSSENKRWITSLIIITYTSLTIYLIIRFLISQYTLEKLRHGESEYNLKERIKELNGIYSLGQLAEKFSNLEDIYHEFVSHVVPNSMLFPEKTIVLLEVEGNKYCTIEDHNLGKNNPYLSAPIMVFDKQAGKLIVTYTEDLPFIDLFEKNLINTFAERISKITERIITQQMLEESESSLLIAQKLANMGSWTLNLSDQTAEWSENCFIIYGYEPFEFEPTLEHVKNRVHPDDWHIVEEGIDSVFKTKTSNISEMRIILPDGTIKWLINNVIPIFQDDKIVKLTGINLDITERKKSEERLKNVNERFLLAIKAASISVWEHDFFTDMIIIDDNFNHIYGSTQGNYQIEFRDFIKFIYPDDVEIVKINIEEAIKSNKNINFEFRIIRPDGNIRNISAYGKIVNDKTNKPVKFIGINMDISDLRNAELAIKESETKYRLIADYNYDWEFWLTKEKKFKYNSPSCERISGYKPIDFSNNPNLFTQIIHKEDLPIYEKHTESVVNGEKCFGIDYRIITHSGDIRWINHICQIVLDENGDNIGIRGSNCDITSRKNAENQILELNTELKRHNVDKDRFISILSHDLRSPFTALLGLSEILKENIQEFHIDEIRNMAGDINKTAQSTLNLLEDLLIWARTQQGKFPFKPQDLIFSDVCKNVLEIINPVADAKNIIINYSAQDQINIFADIDMLKTILRNLVSNSIKFTNNGGKINIDADGNSGYVIISVSDNGIGMNSDNMAKLFDIGQVITTKGTADEKGTGLGLLLCKEFVEKHGGKIWVESEEGKGSKFSFSIPFNPEPNEVNEEKAIVSSNETYSQIRNLKILITDDDEASRKFLGILVKMCSDNIVYAKNGYEAVRVFKDNPDINVILMDIKMPEMDGFEATRQIRQLNKEVIIIVQTAFSDSSEQEKAKEAGCDDFISKPINKTKLNELMKKYCNKLEMNA
jgi:PAS domain S-box-containing protein